MLQDVTACPKCVLFALRNCTRNENKRTSGIAYSLTALDQCHAACVNNGFRTTVVNQLTGSRQTLDTPVGFKHNPAGLYATSQGAPWHSAACVNNGDTQVNGNGRTLTPYRIKTLEFATNGTVDLVHEMMQHAKSEHTFTGKL